MQLFSGLDYVKIDIANHFGLDKLSWDERIAWTNDNYHSLRRRVNEADSKFLYLKGINALEDASKGVETGFIMSLDATASGLQIMAVISGCEKTARATNLIDTGKREDVYSSVTDDMNHHLLAPDLVTRDITKKPLMTYFYGKTKQDTFTDIQEAEFLKTIHNMFPGPEQVLKTVTNCWDRDARQHTWTTPDGHVAHVPVIGIEDNRIEVDELDHTSFAYRYSMPCTSERATSLAPNFIHSLDGWIAREMVRRAYEQRFQLAHIHDSFWAHPNHMDKVRMNYRNILMDLAGMEVLQDFFIEMGSKITVSQRKDLTREILTAEYALS